MYHLGFLPELKGRRLLLHDDIQLVIGVLTHLTSRPHAMMSELRKLFHLTDEIDIKIRTTYIRSAANIWADGLSRLKENSYGRMSPMSSSTAENAAPAPSPRTWW